MLSDSLYIGAYNQTSLHAQNNQIATQTAQTVGSTRLYMMWSSYNFYQGSRTIAIAIYIQRIMFQECYVSTKIFTLKLICNKYFPSNVSLTTVCM